MIWTLCLTLLSTTLMVASGASAEPLKVVASFSIIGDFARIVGGDRIDLTTLVGPGGDAHVYEPKPADAAAMSQADIVLVNGLHFEGFLARLAETSASRARIVELTKGIKPLEMPEEATSAEHADDAAPSDDAHSHHNGADPHAFQAVSNARVYVKNIADAFCAADAAGCDSYRANALVYDAKLEALDAELKAAVAAIPANRRTIITSHDAFGYFANAYGIHFLAPEGISTEAEASAADVARLIRQIRTEKASAVFVENVSDPRLIEQIASETGLKIGGTLYSDALSGPDGPAATYIDLMRHNVTTIKGAVTGS
ncbi:MAG TPA: zinc ABC transporter substrate-binding protein AztC [Mesorhizobium sp.]